MDWDIFPDAKPEADVSGFFAKAPALDFLDDLMGGSLSRITRRVQEDDWSLFQDASDQPKWKINTDYLEDMTNRQRTRERLLAEDKAEGRGGFEPLDVSTQVGLGLRSGGAQLGRAAAGIGEALFIPGSKTAADYYQDKVEGLADLDNPFGSGAGDFANLLSQGAVSVLPTILAGPLGWTGVLAAAGLQSAGGTYADAVDAYEGQGMDSTEAKLKAYVPAIISGVITAGLTKLFGATGAEAFVRQNAIKAAAGKAGPGLARRLFGNDFVDQVASEVSSPLARIGAGMTSEAIEEALDQVGQGVVQKLTYNPEKDTMAILGEAIQAGVIGGVLGGGVTGAKEGLNARVVEPQDETFDVPAVEQPVQGQEAVDEYAQFLDLTREAGSTQPGRPGVVPSGTAFTPPSMTAQPGGVQPLVPSVSRARRDPKRRAAIQIVQGFGISPDISEQVVDQFLAENPDIRVGEDMRTRLIQQIEATGLENEQNNLYREDAGAYELEFPAEAQEIAERARIANQQKIAEVRQRNVERLNRPALPAPAVAPAQLPAPAQEPDVVPELTTRQKADALKLTKKGIPFEQVLKNTDELSRLKRVLADEELAKIPTNAGAVRLRSDSWAGRPHDILIHPSTDPAYKGKWQATISDERGPSGHNVFDSIQDAIESWMGLRVKGEPTPHGDHTFSVVDVRTKKGGEIQSEERKLQEEGQRPLTQTQTGAVTEPVAAPVPSKAKGKQPKLATDVTDFLSYMDVNGIKIKSRAQAGEGSKAWYRDTYDFLTKKTIMRPYFATKPGEGQSLDEVLEDARRNGAPGISEDSTTDDIWDLLESGWKTRSKASENRKKENESLGQRERQLMDFQEVAFENKGRNAVQKKKADVILAGNLSVGDTFTLKGEKVTVTDVNVVEDPETGGFRILGVTLSDGSKYGVQDVEPSEELYIDGKSLKEKPVEFLAGEDLDPAPAPPQASFDPNAAPSVESEPLGFGRGIDGMRELIRGVGNKLPPASRLVMEAWMNTPVMRDLDWDFMQFQIWTGRIMEDGMAGVRVGDVIRVAIGADSQTLPHEFAHVLFDFLPAQYKGYLEHLRQGEVRKKYGETAPQSLIDGTMTSEEFLNANDISVDDYPLINASEFLARYVGQRFADETFAGRNTEKSIWLKIRNWMTGMVDAIRRTFGMEPDMDRVYRELLAGVWRPTKEGIQAMTEAQASFSEDAKAARNAQRLAQDIEQRLESGEDQMAQVQNITDVLDNLGVGTTSVAAQKDLFYHDYSGIARTGQGQMGQKENYQQIKARLKKTLDPREYAFRIKALARLAAQEMTRFENRMREVIKAGDEAMKKLKGVRIQDLMDKVTKAELDKINTETVERANQIITETSLRKAYNLLAEESENDMELAKLQTKINELGAAAQSSTAMSMLMQDIVSVFQNDPQGQAFLESDEFGVEPVPGQPALTSNPIELYRQLKKERDEPFSETLLNWAFFILKRNKKLRDQLYASYLYSTVPGLQSGMNSYQTRLTVDLKADPVGTIRQMLRDKGKAINKREKAKYVYMTLNTRLQDILDELGPKIEAGDIAQAALNDPALIAHAVEVRRDGEYLGTQKPFRPFVDKMVLLPSGRELDVNPERIVGSKDLWDQTRNDYEAGIRELKDWIYDKANLDHPNYKVHEMDLMALEEYFHSQGMNRPADDLGIWAFSFYIAENAIKAAGGRLAVPAKKALAKWSRIKDLVSWWTQRWTKEITDKRRKSIISHKWWNDRDPADGNKLWYTLVGRELADSYAKGTKGYKVGDILSSGEVVTKEDLEDLKTQADATSEGFKIVESEQWSEDTMGEVRAYRKAHKTSDYMTTREFNRDLKAVIGDRISEARKAWLAARKSGNQQIEDDARQDLIDLFNGKSGSTWAMIGRALVADRDPGFSKATIFDGQGSPFQTIASRFKNKNYLGTIDELFAEIESMTEEDIRDIQDIVLEEFSRIVDVWNTASASDEIKQFAHPEETKNSFSRARLEKLAPFVFYNYGFRNTTQATASFSNGIHMRAMDTLLASLHALVKDIQRQKDVFTGKVEILTVQGVKNPEKQVRKEQAKLRRSGKDYDSYKQLERRQKIVQDIIDSLTRNENFDKEGNITMGRITGGLTGFAVSGSLTTARNIITAPRYLGATAMRFKRTALESYGMSIWYSWIDQMLFGFDKNMVPRGGMIPQAAYSGVIKVPFYLTMDFFKALKVIKDPEKSLGMFASKWFYRALTEMGETMHLRIPMVRELRDKGLIFIDSAAKDFENRMLVSGITQGKFMHRKFGAGEKVSQILPTIMEMILVFPKTFAPMFGDNAANAASYKMAMWVRNKTEQNLLQLLADTQWMNGRFDFTNYSNPSNLLDGSELFPTVSKFDRVEANKKLFWFRREFETMGMSFDEEVVKFFDQRQTNPQARFLSDENTDKLALHFINTANKATAANSPLHLKARTPLTTIAAPLMQWPTRMLSNFINNLSIPVEVGEVSDSELLRIRARQWAGNFLYMIIPLLILGGMAVGSGEEEILRVGKSVLYDQVNATRQPWEREGLKSQIIGWGLTATYGIPFVDMAMTAWFNDLPNRASAEPTLLVIEKAKDFGEYVSGVIQTGDFGYRLPELIGGLLPDTKIIFNRLDSEEGKREGANAVAVIRRKGPTEILRPMSGDQSGRNLNELSPMGARLENAILRGDEGEFMALVEETKTMATQMGRADPDKLVKQMVLARSPYNRALKQKLTENQLDQFKARLSPGERSLVDDVEDKFTRAASLIDARFTVAKREPGSTAGTISGGPTMASLGLSAVGAAPRLSRARRRTGLGRIGSTSRVRRGSSRRTSRVRLGRRRISRRRR